jgi:hypothetical protein
MGVLPVFDGHCTSTKVGRFALFAGRTRLYIVTHVFRHAWPVVLFLNSTQRLQVAHVSCRWRILTLVQNLGLLVVFDSQPNVGSLGVEYALIDFSILLFPVFSSFGFEVVSDF